MANQNLADYIKSSRVSGANDEMIRQALLSVGWQKADIDEAFNMAGSSSSSNPIQNPKPAFTSPQNPVVASTMQSFDGTKSEAPVTQSNPITSVQSAGPHFSKKLLISFIIAGVLLLGGGAFGYTQRIWPFNGKSLDPIIAGDIFDSFSLINSANYMVSLSVKSEPKEKGAEPISVEFPELKEKQPLYDRDINRFRDLNEIKHKIEAYYSKNKKYPANFKEIQDYVGYSQSEEVVKIPTKDPLGNLYEYESINNNQDFILKIKFETKEALDAFDKSNYANKKLPKTEGGITSFTKENLYSYVYFSGKPALPFFVEFFNNTDSIDFIPSDIDISIKASGITQNKENSTDKKTDTKFQLSFDALLSDFSVSGDVEFIKKMDNFFVRINKSTIPFFDLGKIKGKWIKITKNDLPGLYSDYDFKDLLNLQSSNEVKSAKVFDQIQLFFKIAKEESAINLSDIGTEKIGNDLFKKYNLSLNRDKLSIFYDRLVKEFNEKFGDKSFVKFDELTSDYLKSQSFPNLFESLSKNNKFEIWTDSKTGFPSKFIYTFRIVPKQDSTEQLTLTATLNLSDINKENIEISEPKESINVEEATILMTGVSRDVYLFNKQEDNISAVTQALKLYKQLSGTYPESLDKLVITIGEAKKINPNPQKAESYDINTPSDMIINNNKEEDLIIQAVPVDVFSGKPYEYKLSNGEYSLIYKIIFPKKVSEDGQSTHYSFYYLEKYVDGINTATPKSKSLEVDIQSKIDQDKDGLADYLEKYYGTDPLKKDTDGDGYNDKIEVSRGDNPLGVGKLK